jgi:hypothetical protein
VDQWITGGPAGMALRRAGGHKIYRPQMRSHLRSFKSPMQGQLTQRSSSNSFQNF